MSVLTAFGLALDLIGAIFITISDPLRFPSRVLIARYWFDRNFPPVAFVKEGYHQVRAGDVYVSQERRLSEEVDPEPDTPQAALNNLNRLERTEVDPILVRKFNRIARLTESAGRLLRDEYSPSSYVNPIYGLYKMTYTPRAETDFDGGGITFHREPNDLAKTMYGDEDHVYTIPVKDFRDKLLEYINAVYLWTGLCLLIVGFSLQILDILITEIVSRL